MPKEEFARIKVFLKSKKKILISPPILLFGEMLAPAIINLYLNSLSSSKTALVGRTTVWLWNQVAKERLNKAVANKAVIDKLIIETKQRTYKKE